MNNTFHSNPAIAQKLDELAQQVRQMKAGGDLEGLLEGEIQQLKTIIYQQAIEIRKQATAADPAAFPPSAVCDMPPTHAQEHP